MPIFDRLKQKLLPKPAEPAHLKHKNYLPPEVSSKLDPSKPAGSYHDFAVITGDQDGPDGPEGDQGAFAIADGRSGDVSKYPLPQRADDPKAVFVANGMGGMLKSRGAKSVILDVPGHGLLHFRPQDVTDVRPEEQRKSPLERAQKVQVQVPVEVSKPELVEDLYDPKLKPSPKTGSIRVRAKQSPLDGPKDMTGIRLGLLGKIRGLDIVLVDGNKIRDLKGPIADVDFTMGGSEARYGYVPLKEIWVEREMKGEDRVATIIHEVSEYHRMMTRGESYDKAHDRAAELENQFRGEVLENECDRADPVDVANEFLDRYEAEPDAKLDEYKNKADRKTYASSIRVHGTHRIARDLPPERVIEWRGLPIGLEVLGGEVRNPDDKFPQFLPPEWLGMGYFIGLVEPDDGDSLDVIIGPEDPEKHPVFLAIQTDPDEGNIFRQWKCFLGFHTSVEVEGAFRILWKREMFGGVWTIPSKMFRKFVLPRIVTKGKKVKKVEKEFAKESSLAKSAMSIVSVAPARIAPPHDVKNLEKASRLVESMRSGGWQGRPVLAYMTGGAIQALTGSHRISAAREAKLQSIPVLLIEDSDFVNDELYTKLDQADDNYDRLRALEKLVKANPVAQEAYELMMEELAEKNKVKRMSRTSGSIRVQAARIQAAGVVDLQGMADRLTEPLARAVHSELEVLEKQKRLDADHARELSRKVSISDQVTAAVSATRASAQKNWSSVLGGYSGETPLKTPGANELFRNTQFKFDLESGNHAKGHFEQLGADSARIVIFLIPIIEALIHSNGSRAPTYREVFSSLKTTIAHEIRHAADWAYQDSARPGKFKDETLGPSTTSTSSDSDVEVPYKVRRQKYYNTPTELKSWAGNVAEKLWGFTGREWRNMSGEELLSWMTDAAPAVFEHLKPENRRTFIQRVLKATEELERDNDARVEKSRQNMTTTATSSSVRVGSGTTKYCSHCKTYAPSGEFFGRDDRWLHRPCSKHGPVKGDKESEKKASVRVSCKKKGAGELIERAIDQLSGGDIAHRQQLEQAARSLLAQDYDESEVIEQLKGQRHLEKLKQTPAPQVPGAELVSETPTHWIFAINTFDACKRLGTQKWCMARDPSVWEDYTQNHGAEFFFHVNKKTGKADYAVAKKTQGGRSATESYDANNDVILDSVPGVHDYYEKEHGAQDLGVMFNVKLQKAIEGDTDSQAELLNSTNNASAVAGLIGMGRLPTTTLDQLHEAFEQNAYELEENHGLDWNDAKSWLTAAERVERRGFIVRSNRHGSQRVHVIRPWHRTAGPERVQVLKQKYPQLAGPISHFALNDPSNGQQKYLDWALRAYQKKPEAGQEIIEAMHTFHRLQKYMGTDKYSPELKSVSKDINSYKGVDVLKSTLEKVQREIEGQMRIEQAQKLYGKKYEYAIREFARSDPTKGKQAYLPWALTQFHRSIEGAGQGVPTYQVGSSGLRWNDWTEGVKGHYRSVYEGDLVQFAPDPEAPEDYVQVIDASTGAVKGIADKHVITTLMTGSQGKLTPVETKPRELNQEQVKELINRISSTYGKYHEISEKKQDIEDATGGAPEELGERPYEDVEQELEKYEPFLGFKKPGVIAENDNYIAYGPITNKAQLCSVGTSKWCVARWGDNFFESDTYMGDKEGDPHFIMIQSREDPDAKWLAFVRNSGIAEIKDQQNSETDASEFGDLFEAAGVSSESPEIKVFYISVDGYDRYPYLDENEHYVREQAEDDNSLRGHGYEIHSGYVNREEYEDAQDNGDTSNLDISNSQRIESVEPQYETYYFVSPGDEYGDPADAFFADTSLSDIERWLQQNLRQATVTGWVIWQAQVSVDQPDNDRFHHWTVVDEEMVDQDDMPSDDFLVEQPPSEEHSNQMVPVYVAVQRADKNSRPYVQAASEQEAVVRSKMKHGDYELYLAQVPATDWARIETKLSRHDTSGLRNLLDQKYAPELVEKVEPNMIKTYYVLIDGDPKISAQDLDEVKQFYEKQITAEKDDKEWKDSIQLVEAMTPSADAEGWNKTQSWKKAKDKKVLDSQTRARDDVPAGQYSMKVPFEKTPMESERKESPFGRPSTPSHTREELEEGIAGPIGTVITTYRMSYGARESSGSTPPVNGIYTKIGENEWRWEGGRETRVINSQEVSYYVGGQRFKVTPPMTEMPTWQQDFGELSELLNEKSSPKENADTSVAPLTVRDHDKWQTPPEKGEGDEYEAGNPELSARQLFALGRGGRVKDRNDETYTQQPSGIFLHDATGHPYSSDQLAPRGVRRASLRMNSKSARVVVRTKPIKTSPDKSPSNLTNDKADKAFRYDGPTYKDEHGKKHRKTPGVVNDGSTGRQTGIQTDGGPGGGVSGGGGGGGGGGMGAAASIRLTAVDRLILRRSGHRTYEGSYGGRKIRVQAEELVEKGSYPGNRRQRRATVWKVAVDGQEVGQAPNFREARDLAFAACTAPMPRSAGSISVMDTEGQEHTTYLEQVRIGDRVRFKRNFIGTTKGGKIEIEHGMLAEVQAVDTFGPSLTVFVRGVMRGDRGKEMKIGRHSVRVPTEEVMLMLPAEDPRVHGRTASVRVRARLKFARTDKAEMKSRLDQMEVGSAIQLSVQGMPRVFRKIMPTMWAETTNTGMTKQMSTNNLVAMGFDFTGVAPNQEPKPWLPPGHVDRNVPLSQQDAYRPGGEDALPFGDVYFDDKDFSGSDDDYGDEKHLIKRHLSEANEVVKKSTQNLRKIYELEYKLALLRPERKKGPLADRAEKNLALWDQELSTRVDSELQILKAAYDDWLKESVEIYVEGPGIGAFDAVKAIHEQLEKPPQPLNARIVLLHHALTTAHNSASMATFAYGGGRAAGFGLAKAVQYALDKLSEKPDPAWDKEVQHLLALPKGGSITVRRPVFARA